MIGSKHKTPDQLVAEYLAEVDRGEGIGELEAAMVERYRREISGEANARGWHFDEKRARLACGFFPRYLQHTAGELGAHAEPFHLLPWQCFAIWNIYGWRYAGSGKRRFRRVFIYLARKGGKTQFSGGIVLKELIGHPLEFPEPESEFYCCATKEEQATRLWQAVHSMLVHSDELKPRLGNFHIIGEKNRSKSGQMTILSGPTRGSYFKALGSDGKTQDSLSPNLVIFDEYHAYRSTVHRDLVERLRTGSGARQQALEVIISTAGDDESEMLEDELAYCRHVVQAGAKGEVVDDRLFAAIYKLDDDDDIFDSSNWRKANPGLGIAPRIDEIRDMVNEARNKPSTENTVRRFFMNLTTSSHERAFAPESWLKGASCLLPDPQVQYSFGGLDMAINQDWASYALCFPRMLGGQWHYGFKVWTWACAGTRGDIDFLAPPFDGFIRAGSLKYSSDELLNPAAIKATVLEESYRDGIPCKEIYFDRVACLEMAADLENNYKLPMKELPQNAMRYEPIIRAFLDALEGGRIHHQGDPVLDWQAGNCEWHKDYREYRMPHKGSDRARKKIDTVVAMLMSFGAALAVLPKPVTGPAYYQVR